jgi:hypothetical protein
MMKRFCLIGLAALLLLATGCQWFPGGNAAPARAMSVAPDTPASLSAARICSTVKNRIKPRSMSVW